MDMNIYDFEVLNVEGKPVSMKQFESKVLLIVNTATHCGFTPQYKGLEKLYQDYKDKGFEVLDFPCNQFMNQAPESNEEINHICEIDYQTTFPRFSKIHVNGRKTLPLYRYLKEHAPKEFGSLNKPEGLLSRVLFRNRIKWNFTKFLVNQHGEIIARYGSQVKPEAIADDIQKLF